MNPDTKPRCVDCKFYAPEAAGTFWQGGCRWKPTHPVSSVLARWIGDEYPAGVDEDDGHDCQVFERKDP